MNRNVGGRLKLTFICATMPPAAATALALEIMRWA